MMNALVTRYLNIRTGTPELLPDNNPGFLKPNDVVKIVDTVLGQEYKGNAIWHKLEDGSFVWSGALDARILETTLDWWHTSYRFADTWKALNTLGEHARIAVIDSGVDLSHPFLDKKLIFGMSTGEPVTDFSDEYGHGTEVTSVICGNRVNAFGAAPMCPVFMIKVTNTGTMTPEQLMQGLAAIPAGIDIVNISQTLRHTDQLHHELGLYFQAHPDKVFVCGAGNDGHAQVYDNLPAAASKDFPHVISVAGLNKQGEASTYFSCKSNYLTLAAPGEEIMTMNKYDPSKLYPSSGTSLATPIVSALLALGRSYLVKQNKFNGMDPVTKALCTSIRSVEPPQKELYGAGIIDPGAFVETLQKL